MRRKLKIRQKHRFVVEKDRAGYALNPGMLQAPERQAAFAWGLQQTVQFMNDCVAQGLVEWLPDAPTPR